MSPRPPEGSLQPPDQVRLQKVLALAGLGSRRACEELIAAGRVTVNGRVAVLGVRVDPARDNVEVDGARIPTAPQLAYFALNKPPGVVTAMVGDGVRPTVGDLLAERMGEPVPGLHHIGRLDADSEGLLLLSNDGSLSHLLSHPSHGVPKRYLVEVAGVVPRALGRALREGVELEDGPARVDEYVLVDSTPGRSLVEVVIHEGRTRLVRRMFEATGHPVRRLVRTEVGPLRLGELKPGRWRRLSPGEVRSLYASVDK